MIEEFNKKYRLILATSSPRRHELVRQMGIPFTVGNVAVDEEPPPGLGGGEIACYLAGLKADASLRLITDESTLVLTADTVVWVDGQSLGKPSDEEEAFEMLSALSGRKHQVITGVCLSSSEKRKTFCVSTDVYFKELDPGEIRHYIRHYKPFDKAGAYGVQEWIGIIGIRRIEGSYFNVVGLPVQRVYEELMAF